MTDPFKIKYAAELLSLALSISTTCNLVIVAMFLDYLRRKRP